VLACPDFPGCVGTMLPNVAWSDGFTLLRDLGKNPDGSYLSVEGLRAIHWAHRIGALLVTIIIVIAAIRLMRASVSLKRQALFIKIALTLQIAIGISTVLFDQPILVATAHNFFAAVLLATLIVAAYRINAGSQFTRSL
jgi:heme a synthase